MKKVLFCIDGFTFRRINDFYRDEHVRQSRLQPAGLRQWVRFAMARYLQWDADSDQLSLECHFYHPYDNPRVRLGVAANQAGGLRFESLLLETGYKMHYSEAETVRRLRPNLDLCDDVLLAAVYGQADALVLLSTQGHYTALLRHLGELNIPVLLLGFEGPCRNRAGESSAWKTDERLKQLATHYVELNALVGESERSAQPWVEQLFIPRKAGCPVTPLKSTKSQACI